MTAKEIKELLSSVDFNSFTDEELESIHDTMSVKSTEIKCIRIRRKHLKIRHPIPKEQRAN